MISGHVSAVLLLALAVNGSLGDDAAGGNLRGAAEITEANSVREMPDSSGQLDHPGPYEEEPSSADAKKPKPAMANWSVQSLNVQEPDFCDVHQTGYWCNGFTRVRCCKLADEGGFAKCGSTANSSLCGWQSPTANHLQNLTGTLTALSTWWPPIFSGSWHIHRGWHVSSFCQSHHVGSYCSSHHIVHCCNDYGHYVECNTAYHHSSWWC